MKVVTLSVSQDLKNQLDDFMESDQGFSSRSDFIRVAIAEEMKRAMVKIYEVNISVSGPVSVKKNGNHYDIVPVKTDYSNYKKIGQNS